MVLDFTHFVQTPDERVRARLPFAVKQLSSAIRAATPSARVALDFSHGPGEPFSLDFEEGFGAYFDAISTFAGRLPPVFSDEGKERWLFLLRERARSAPGARADHRGVSSVFRGRLPSHAVHDAGARGARA